MTKEQALIFIISEIQQMNEIDIYNKIPTDTAMLREALLIAEFCIRESIMKDDRKNIPKENY